jgi:DNA anti-recombination protein RmuC
MMKHRTLLFTVLAMATCTMGCNKEGTTAQQLDKLQARTAEATQDLKENTFAQKTEFTDKMRTQLAEINQELDQLAAKIEKSTDAAKAEARPKLQPLRDKADQLKKQLDEAGNATESTWETVKATSKQGYAELKEGFTQARQWVSEKIAP